MSPQAELTKLARLVEGLECLLESSGGAKDLVTNGMTRPHVFDLAGLFQRHQRFLESASFAKVLGQVGRGFRQPPGVAAFAGMFTREPVIVLRFLDLTEGGKCRAGLSQRAGPGVGIPGQRGRLGGMLGGTRNATGMKLGKCKSDQGRGLGHVVSRWDELDSRGVGVTCPGEVTGGLQNPPLVDKPCRILLLAFECRLGLFPLRSGLVCQTKRLESIGDPDANVGLEGRRQIEAEKPLSVLQGTPGLTKVIEHSQEIVAYTNLPRLSQQTWRSGNPLQVATQSRSSQTSADHPLGHDPEPHDMERDDGQCYEDEATEITPSTLEVTPCSIRPGSSSR